MDSSEKTDDFLIEHHFHAFHHYSYFHNFILFSHHRRSTDIPLLSVHKLSYNQPNVLEVMMSRNLDVEPLSSLDYSAYVQEEPNTHQHVFPFLQVNILCEVYGPKYSEFYHFCHLTEQPQSDKFAYAQHFPNN